jgi:hypothetical protein
MERAELWFRLAGTCAERQWLRHCLHQLGSLRRPSPPVSCVAWSGTHARLPATRHLPHTGRRRCLPSPPRDRGRRPPAHPRGASACRCCPSSLPRRPSPIPRRPSPVGRCPPALSGGSPAGVCSPGGGARVSAPGGCTSLRSSSGPGSSGTSCGLRGVPSGPGVCTSGYRCPAEQRGFAATAGAGIFPHTGPRDLLRERLRDPLWRSGRKCHQLHEHD